MWPHSIKQTDQEPENVSDVAAPAQPDNGEPAPAALEENPPPAAAKQWDHATEEEWNEHSATSWALAYVIHRIRSTPHPPILLPEQRLHFHKIIERAAALIEEWQRRERDQAQQLAQGRPVTELSLEAAGASQDGLPDNTADEDWSRLLFTPSYHLFLEEDEEEARPAGPKAQDAPTPPQDYQI